MALRLEKEAPMEDSRAKWWGMWWRSIRKKETEHRRAVSRTQKPQLLGVRDWLDEFLLRHARQDSMRVHSVPCWKYNMGKAHLCC